MGFWGFGKDAKKTFRVPTEISELRMRIEAESREKFPSLARYQEISKVAGMVSRYLDDVILQKEHAEEAARIREDLKKKLEALGEKIKRNMQEGQKEVKKDYVESNIDYLERKSMRNHAKTAFTELLEHAAIVGLFAQGAVLPHGKQIEAVIAELFATVADLQDNYFTLHGEDREVQALKVKTREKIDELERAINERSTRFSEAGLDVNLKLHLSKYRQND